MNTTIEIPVLPEPVDINASEELFHLLYACLLDYVEKHPMVFNDVLISASIFHAGVVEMTERAMIDEGNGVEKQILVLRVAVLQTLRMMLEGGDPQGENDG